ncbi:hypothetical protein Ddye_006800 [Dipteronia dyeriana]|uniref:Uncharacterized protein n=1 Tax=Dipteronia dyeriana TaxID=168575 RepID=A0AAE0CR12_9ROSI|nr:hypothetical protein Ddye_006800 [Dipteronia dyeriana]
MAVSPDVTARELSTINYAAVAAPTVRSFSVLLRFSISNSNHSNATKELNLILEIDVIDESRVHGFVWVDIACPKF